MALDDKGRPLAVPKPEGKKKKKSSKSSAPTKTVNQKAVDAKIKERNDRNRSFGKSVERAVAVLTGGNRVPASGAIKNSVWQLEGDVNVPDPVNPRKTLFLIECKGTSAISPSGDKTYTLKKSVLDQARNEAELQGAMDATWIHWKNANYEQDDYVIVSARTWLLMLERLREQITLEEKAS